MSHAYGSLPRKEDARFVRGQGQFVDDIALPGMLHGAILRSPLAHARVLSVDASAAQAHPAVIAVLTGADLAERGLAWMPTVFGDTQAVLATDKVRFQGQEIASRTSSGVGSGLLSSSHRAVIIMPGVQKPHCSP